MLTLRRHHPDVDLAAIDQRVYLRFLGWKHFKVFLRSRGDAGSGRLTYNEGSLEIMSSSWNHELIKKNLARLIEVWAVEFDVPLNGYGSWLLKHESSKSALEPDECYLFGPRAGRAVPDLAVEVRWTTGGIEKLPIYARLGVKEVWVWDKGHVVPWVLRGAAYVKASRSSLLPALDLKLLAKHSLNANQAKAIRAFLKASKK